MIFFPCLFLKRLLLRDPLVLRDLRFYFFFLFYEFSSFLFTFFGLFFAAKKKIRDSHHHSFISITCFFTYSGHLDGPTAAPISSAAPVTSGTFGSIAARSTELRKMSRTYTSACKLLNSCTRYYFACSETTFAHLLQLDLNNIMTYSIHSI